MPEIHFNGPDGRLEGRYQPSKLKNPPIALVLHPHPQHGGNMNNKIVFTVYNAFLERGFTVMRFNFRGVGKSEGVFDHGLGELSDAAAALDWLQSFNTNATKCWVAGFSFGAWIGMQLLMRRPEIDRFIALAPPANMFDFSFLAPCPSSGLIIHGTADQHVPEISVNQLFEKLNAQKTINVDLKKIRGADHFFTNQLDDLKSIVDDYFDINLGKKT
ncbi:alpha/beta hydrolase [Alphaproteobacteria bacterium]|nr:alpha/beta hydrolase [Alphaproteobacteria bacterium]